MRSKLLPVFFTMTAVLLGAGACSDDDTKREELIIGPPEPEVFAVDISEHLPRRPNRRNARE